MGFLRHDILRLTVFALLAAGCSGLRTETFPAQRPGGWPMFARTVAHDAGTADTLRLPLTQSWNASIGAATGSGSPLIVDSMVLVGTLRGELCGYNLRTGKSLGAVTLGEAIHGSPVVDRRYVYAALTGGSGGMVCYDIVDGRTVWRSPGGDIEMSPLLLRRKLYAGTTTGEFFCLDAVNGNRLWTFSLPRNLLVKGIRSSPAAVGCMVIFGADDGSLYGLDDTTGTLLWSINSGSGIEAAPVISDGMVFVGNRTGSVIAVDTTGALRWRTETRARITGNAVVIDSLLVVGTLSGEVFGLRRADGSRIWVTPAGGAVSGGGISSGTHVLFGTLTRRVIALDASTGTVTWRADVDGRIKSAPAGGSQSLLFTTDERTLYSFQGAAP
jgi:outer membrane protein assembly factor BamB